MTWCFGFIFEKFSSRCYHYDQVFKNVIDVGWEFRIEWEKCPNEM